MVRTWEYRTLLVVGRHSHHILETEYRDCKLKAVDLSYIVHVGGGLPYGLVGQIALCRPPFSRLLGPRLPVASNLLCHTMLVCGDVGYLDGSRRSDLFPSPSFTDIQITWSAKGGPKFWHTILHGI